jgi:hypothetical protein
MRRLVLAWIAALIGCTPTLADDALSYCRPLCDCLGAPLPAAQRECTAECRRMFEADPLSTACVACVVEHTDRCATLLDDCVPVCSQPVPPQDLELHR